VAASYLGPEINHHLFITALNQVYTIKPTETGFLALVRTRMANLNKDAIEKLDKEIGKIQSKLLKARRKIGEFFEKLSNAIAKIPSSNDYAREITYTSLTGFISQDLIDDTIIAVKSIETMVLELADEIELTDELSDKTELAIRGRAIAQDMMEIRKALEFLCYPDETNFVYWAEVNQKRDVKLVSAPLDVGKILDEKLYEQLKSMVLCSATLSVTGNFDYYKRRLGLDLSSAHRTAEIALDSPFDLKHAIGFFEAGFLPAPNLKNYDKQAAEAVYQLFAEVRVKGMVLFTSYRTMTSVVDEIGEKLIAKGFELYVQNNNMSPFQLLSRYRQSPRGILFGTDSFWEGVDLPGDELELLVIAKLPFAVPDRPWIKANLDKIEREGGNPFMDYSLPEAIIKFRQGFGRLIRKKTDRGCVISLDSRLTGKQYGRMFIMSVKPSLRVCPSMNSLVHSISKYFKG
jgi:ATP-dependent DNA helicase DinG